MAKLTGVYVLGALILVALVGVGYLVSTGGLSQQTAISGSQVTPGDGGTIINTVNPTVTVNGVDKQQTGTSVPGTLKMATDGGSYATVTSGTTTAVPGQRVKLLFTNNTGYHNAVTDEILVSPGSFPVTLGLNANATVTETMFNTNGVAMTDGGLATGSVNQTVRGNGASYTFKDSMVGTALKSTQAMTCIFELTDGTACSATPACVGLSTGGNSIPLVSTSKPSWYTVAGTTSNVYLFDVPALDSSAQVDYAINLNTKSTDDFDAVSRMIKRCYTKEWFIDPNGQLVFDVVDSQSTVKSIAQYDYTIFFQ